MKAYYFLKQNGRSPLMEHLDSIDNKSELSNLHSAIDRLIRSQARLPYPFAEHIEGKIWALRSYHGNHRVYYCVEGDAIILLDGYQKKSMRIDHRMLHNILSHYREYQFTGSRRQYFIPL